jgi:hypothetical protein
MINVEVGKDGAEWLLHENLLVEQSAFARAASTHNVKERADRTIKMPEAAAASFDIFVNYMYSRKLDATLLSLDNLFAAYILADYVVCPAFADAVFEEIHARRASAVTPSTAEQIHFVLTNILSDRPLRTPLLDQVGRLILKANTNSTAKKTKIFCSR